MSLFNNTSFRLLQQGLDAVWLKQQVINQNIANSDTPEYKARTVHFRAVLEEKKNELKRDFKNSDEELNLRTTITTERGTNQTFNGNNVDIEKEAIALADAQIQYESLVNKISNEFSMIRTAISR